MRSSKRVNAFALSQYAATSVVSGVEGASPHRLIEMLLDGALAKIAVARGNMERSEIAEKGANISWAISIIEGLRGSLDLKGGGEIAENLNSLYDYSSHRLMEANVKNEAALLDEVTRLLSEIRSAWITIKPPPAAQAGAMTANVA